MQERVDLHDSTFKGIGIRGLKKLLVDLSSLKFLALVFIGYLTADKIVSDFVGVGAMLALLGIREGFEYLSGRNGYGPVANIRFEGGSMKVPE